MISQATDPNKTTAPAANAVLAAFTSRPRGTYDLTVYACFYAAAPQAADAANIQLRVGSTVQFAIPVAPIQNQWQTFKYKVKVPPAGATIDLQAIGAGTASVTYMTQLVLDSGAS